MATWVTIDHNRKSRNAVQMTRSTYRPWMASLRTPLY